MRAYPFFATPVAVEGFLRWLMGQDRNKPRCVIHFFHHKFKRCEIMDKHLSVRAPLYNTSEFVLR